MLVTPSFMFVSMFARSAKPFSVVPVIYRKCIALLKYRRSETALPIKNTIDEAAGKRLFYFKKTSSFEFDFNFMRKIILQRT